MPKATSKKKKFNARFPPARIKKIMQTDEEVGKVAAAVPVIISRALEMFIESLVTETSKVTLEKNAKTLSTSHIKQTITATKEFDFLRNLVENVPDHQIEDNERRGRPKSIDGCRKTKSKGNKTSSEEEDDDCDDDAEDTETDEESSNSWTPHPADMKPNTSFLPGAQPNVSYPQRSDIKPNIGHLIQAASTLQQQQQLNSFQPPVLMQPPLPNNTMSHNNNNYVPSSAVGSASLQGFSVVRDSLISGKNTAPFLHHQGLPLSSDSVPTSILADFKPNLYQMPSNINSPPTSHFSSQLPSKVFYNNSGSNPLSSPPYLQSPVSEKLSQQYQPIDLSQPLRHNMNEQDDYDA